MDGTGKFPLVIAVVLNWHRFDESKRCIESLTHDGYPNLRIVLVDNGSTDESGEKLRTEFPHITFVFNQSNLGFARGCNAGIRVAVQNPECEYVLLLNNDATLADGALAFGVRAAQAQANIGAISGKILLSGRNNTIWYAGGRIKRWRGQADVFGLGETDHGQFDNSRETEFVTGAMMLIKREVLERVGLLPEEYFFGVEEWDYSERIKRAGYKLYYASDFVCYHAADGSHWNYDPKFVYNSYRSKLIFQERYLPRPFFPLWKIGFALYGKYFARRLRRRLIRKHGFDAQQPVALDDLDYALTRALADHRKNELSEEVLNRFEQELMVQHRQAGLCAPRGVIARDI